VSGFEFQLDILGEGDIPHDGIFPFRILWVVDMASRQFHEKSLPFIK